MERTNQLISLVIQVFFPVLKQSGELARLALYGIRTFLDFSEGPFLELWLPKLLVVPYGLPLWFSNHSSLLLGLGLLAVVGDQPVSESTLLGTPSGSPSFTANIAAGQIPM